MPLRAVQREVDRFTRAGLLFKRVEGNRAYYQVNMEHPLFPELRALVIKTAPPALQLRGAAALDPAVDFTPHPLVLLCALTILINLMLCIFNLLPIPPLDGSRLMRNMLPYNAVQAYDRIPIWVSYLLMIFVGGTIIRAFVVPAIGMVVWALVHV